MPAFLEPLTYIVRAGPEARRFEDDYVASGTVTTEDGVATVRGFAGRLDRGLRDDIVAAILAAGYHKVRWGRRKNGRWVYRTVTG